MIVYNTATTANGFLADPQDSLDWLFQVEGEAPDMVPFMDTVTACVMGSSTYEWLLRAEGFLDTPEYWPTTVGAWPVFVFSSRDLPVPEGADVRVVRGNVAGVLPTILTAAGDGAVWLMGGGDLVGQFLDVGALDRIVMTLAPAFLPGGKPLLPRTLLPEDLALEGARAVGQFVEVTYRVVRTHGAVESPPPDPRRTA